MDVPDPPSTLLLVGLLCLLPCGLHSSSYSSSSLGRSFSLSDDDLHSLSLDVVLTFVRDDTVLYRLLQRFSLPASKRKKSDRRQLGKIGFLRSVYSLALEFSPKKPTRSHSPEQ